MPADYTRPTLKTLAAYVPGEQPQDRRYIKLNTNENPYPPSPQVIAAVQQAVNADLRLYPDPLANALRDRAAAVYGFSRDHILFGNGSDELLNLIIRACIDPGERVASPYPTYSLYDTLVEIQDGIPVRVPYPPDFSLPTTILGEARARITFVCHPNSPSGTAVPMSAIRTLAAQVAGLLVVDEAYVDFAETTALSLVKACDNVIVLRTFSKSFSLAGMRIGLAFAPPPLIEQFIKVKDSYNVTRLSISAATAALQDLDWMHANVSRIRRTREYATTQLWKRGFSVLPSQANFVLARRAGTRLEGIYLGLKERGVLVRYFDTVELEDALRITIGTDAEMEALFQALDAIPHQSRP